MTWRRRGGVFAVLAVIAYVVALSMGNYYLAREVRANLTTRLQATFGGTVTIGEVDVGLWRGTASARDIVIARGANGVAAGEIAEVSATFARGGAVLWSRELHQLVLRDGRLALPLAALSTLQTPRPARLWSRRVVVERLTISISPSASMPGVLSSRLALVHVVSGRTQVRSLVSWLEAVQEVEGSLVVPIVGDLSLRLREQRLALNGSLVPHEISIVYAPPRLPATASDGERVKAIVSHVLRGVSEQLGATWALQTLINVRSKW